GTTSIPRVLRSSSFRPAPSPTALAEFVFTCLRASGDRDGGDCDDHELSPKRARGAERCVGLAVEAGGVRKNLGGNGRRNRHGHIQRTKTTDKGHLAFHEPEVDHLWPERPRGASVDVSAHQT